MSMSSTHGAEILLPTRENEGRRDLVIPNTFLNTAFSAPYHAIYMNLRSLAQWMDGLGG